MYKPLLLLIVIFSSVSYGQTDTIFCQQLVAVKKLVKENHYQPKAINDSLSKGVFDLFITSLDQDKDYFLQTDIAQFKADQFQIDDYLLSDNCTFVEQFKAVLITRIENTKTILGQLNTTIPDYSGGLTLQYKPSDQYIYYKDYNALATSIEKLVGYKVMTSLLDNNDDIAYIKANFATLEASTRLDVIKNELCLLEQFSSISGGLDRYVKDAFINAFLQYHDPHSVFFNPTEKLIYESGLSSNQLSFGITTEKNNEGQIIIAQITPGSAAFKNGNIETEDVIISLTANGTTLKTLCVSNDAIEAFSNKEDHKTISFLIKKQNGTEQNITLTKTKIKVEDNAIKGFLIGEDKALGYIKIPRFYTNDESINGRGVTSDFAKELYKLQKQNIQGLIIDLRFNGGGSMGEAIELTGMFIDRGPVTIIKTNLKDTYTIRDVKRGTYFSKPVIVLVNNYSASASEFFAAAMQDYNRALIVGSTTHGKSSAQSIIALDDTKNIGYCKITMEKFYRVTGQSHQAIGVIPDLKLPSVYNDLDSGEQFYDYVLQNDTVTPEQIFKPLQKKDYSTLISKNKQRLSVNTAFTQIAENNIKLKESIFALGPQYALTLDEVNKTREQKRTLYNQIFPNDTDQVVIAVSNTASTEKAINYNTDNDSLNAGIINQLSQDIYIAETYSILKDLINLKN
ncbi:carboxy terminal-processing peptidase [Olleya sp. HaHaR_3_96]|uniref:carboxy terminal-processing peptidase n=1 Tax=Olleya sp. HaHaR_3_96 TaxID=2745560 RepID=UPI001C4E6914|nr:carboxy terminal-processing peptidase [Olleya sp. HaHaR_3_96]QXP59031.1 carboxy terminal-processing peptidase [Olleya sp. HaHaR_3_96]